ncbi:MAG: STAS domain-containing protein [Candidatus Aquicultorales bacterium]
MRCYTEEMEFGDREANIKILIERDGGRLLVRLQGDADLFSSSIIKRELSGQLLGVYEITFDLADLDFADSYFIKLLIHLRKRLGGVSSVTLINPKPGVRRVFEVTGLDALFIR